MFALVGFVVVITLAQAPTLGAGTFPGQIDVDCSSSQGLERALIKAARNGDEVNIVLHGVCRGHYVISGGNVVLRAATPESGLAVPEGDTSFLPVIEVIEADATLRGLSVEGGDIGVVVRGWNANLLLVEVGVHDQSGGGVFVTRGARARLIDSTVRNALFGVQAQGSAEVILQNVVVEQQDVAVAGYDGSFLHLENPTIQNNREAGLIAGDRSDANVVGGAFHENGGIHIFAADRSSITLLSTVAVGSPSDTTLNSLGVSSYADISSFSSPALYGNASAVIGGSLQFGETVLNGDLLLFQFSNAFVRDAQITGMVTCQNGSDSICDQTTTAGASGCASPTCGSAPVAAVRGEPAVPRAPRRVVVRGIR